MQPSIIYTGKDHQDNYNFLYTMISYLLDGCYSTSGAESERIAIYYTVLFQGDTGLESLE